MKKLKRIQVEGVKGAALTGCMILMGSISSMFMLQYMILDEYHKLSSNKTLLNIICALCVYLICCAITGRSSLGCAIAHLILLVLGIADYYVYQFRGNEITFGDVRTVRTGLSVASNYRFEIPTKMMLVVTISVVYLGILMLFRINYRQTRYLRAICLSLSILCMLYVAERSAYTVTETWQQKGSARNGYLLNFGLSIWDSFVQKPENYSLSAIEELEEQYQQKEQQSQPSEKQKKPTVIAIMDESFADLEVVGEIETNYEVLPYYHSMEENTIKGYALAPVYGAKTPNSEWEFLTGQTMQFLPTGSVVYQQYLNNQNAASIVDQMKENDYTCVAMHPYYATGWSRDRVYQKMGFDEMYFLDDFDQSNLMRKYVSDEVMFDKIIERYEESKEKENLFLFGVTMQNHGGYTEEYEDFTNEIRSSNLPYRDLNQYLTLINKTDQAIRKLISYFDEQEEPIVICLFGDHQPSLNTTMYRGLNGKGLSNLSLDELENLFKVPFFIWSNQSLASQEVSCTSLNYLSTIMMQVAGIELTPYQKFLVDLQKEIPAMNVRGYYSKSAGCFLRREKALGEEAEWLEKYEMLQYNNLFDKRHRSDVFFR